MVWWIKSSSSKIAKYSEETAFIPAHKEVLCKPTSSLIIISTDIWFDTFKSFPDLYFLIFDYYNSNILMGLTSNTIQCSLIVEITASNSHNQLFV